MKEFVQLLGSDDPLASGSALLWTEGVRAVVNCPEGVQRFASEVKLRLPRVTRFFFTRVTPGSFMGFPGVLFTVNDTGVSKLNVAGPAAALSRAIGTVKRHFFHYRKLEVSMAGDDDATPQITTDAEVPGTVWRCGALEVVSLGNTAGDGASKQQPSTIVSYLCRAAAAVVFDANAAKQLGVKPGKKYAQLKAGTAVSSDTIAGRTVAPHEVTKSAPAARGVLLWDCATVPSPDMWATWDAGFATATGSTARVGPDSVHTVVHLAPFDIVQGAEYRAAMSTVFPPSAVRHIVASSDPQERLTGFPTSLANRYHSHSIHPRFVRLPGGLDACVLREEQCERLGCDGQGLFPTEGDERKKKELEAVPGVPSVVWRFQRRHMIREKEAGGDNYGDTMEVTFPTPDVALSLLSDEFRQRLEGLRHSTEGSSAAQPPPPPPPLPSMVDEEETPPAVQDVGIDFFGTGSAIPSKYRNVSCAVVQPVVADAERRSGPGAVMLDCGEGSTGQMWNGLTGSALTGRRSLDPLLEYVGQVSFVFISHMHADHHLGLFSFLELRRRVAGIDSRPPLVIAGPRVFLEFFRTMVDEVFASSSSKNNGTTAPPVQFVTIDDLADVEIHGDGTSMEPEAECLAKLCSRENLGFTCFAVDHPAFAYGARFVWNRSDASSSPSIAAAPPLSVVYSGDTQPCAAVDRYCRDVDVVIHEATFGEGMEAEARSKRHSTVQEAVAAGATAKAVFLTHFSQRYPKLPEVSKEGDSALGARPEVCVGFDLQTVPRALHGGDAKVLASLTPLYQALLAEYDSWGEGTSKRLRNGGGGTGIDQQHQDASMARPSQPAPTAV